MATQQEVFSVIREERVFQDRKWGTIQQHPHEVGSWLTIMRQLLNDAERAYMSKRGGLWVCDYCGSSGYGASPVAAYFDCMHRN